MKYIKIISNVQLNENLFKFFFIKLLCKLISFLEINPTL